MAFRGFGTLLVVIFLPTFALADSADDDWWGDDSWNDNSECADLVSIIYDDCAFEIADGSAAMSEADARLSCEDGGSSWDCMSSCVEASATCSDFAACAASACGVTLNAASTWDDDVDDDDDDNNDTGDDADDDDDDDDSCCGAGEGAAAGGALSASMMSIGVLAFAVGRRSGRQR